MGHRRSAATQGNALAPTLPGVEGIRITPVEAFAFAVVGNVLAVEVEP
jgi:hypothetical protein